MHINFLEGVLRRGAVLWFAILSCTAVAADKTLPELNECYAESSGLKDFFTAYTVESPGRRTFKCVHLDQQCKPETVEKIVGRWSDPEPLPRADGSIPVVPLQVFLALKQRGCKVDERDFLVPSDAQLHSIEPECSMGNRCKVNFKRPKNKSEPCFAQMWQMRSADKFIPPVMRPKYWTGRSDESCELTSGDQIRRLPDQKLEKSDWLELHNELVKQKLFPVLQRSNVQDTVIELNGKYQFENISLRIPPIPDPDPYRLTPSPNSGAPNSTSGGTGRDVALAGSGALLLLLARWLRELLWSRKKPIGISATTAKVTNRDLKVTGRWIDEFAQQEKPTLPVDRLEP